MLTRLGFVGCCDARLEVGRGLVWYGVAGDDRAKTRTAMDQGAGKLKDHGHGHDGYTRPPLTTLGSKNKNKEKKNRRHNCNDFQGSLALYAGGSFVNNT